MCARALLLLRDRPYMSADEARANKRAKSDDESPLVAAAPLDWESVARAAQADLVNAREALTKVKAMLSAKLRMDIENERLQRSEAEVAALRGTLLQRQTDLEAAHTALAARDFVLQRQRLDALAERAGLSREQSAAFMDALFAPPIAELWFETALDTTTTVTTTTPTTAASTGGFFTRSRLPSLRVHVRGADVEQLRWRKLSVRVSAVLASQQCVPGAIEGTLVVPLDATGGAAFHNVRFVMSSHAAGDLFALSFELLTQCEGGMHVRVLGVPALLSQPPFAVKSR